MSVPTPLPPCPNCGLPWPANAAVCPNCGYVRLEIPSWPPPPSSQPGVPPPPPKLVTGNATGDILLGVGISVSSFFVVIGIIAIPILYFSLRRRYPILSRSLGYGWLAGMILLLSPLAICIGIGLIGRIHSNGSWP